MNERQVVFYMLKTITTTKDTIKTYPVTRYGMLWSLRHGRILAQLIKLCQWCFLSSQFTWKVHLPYMWTHWNLSFALHLHTHIFIYNIATVSGLLQVDLQELSSCLVQEVTVTRGTVCLTRYSRPATDTVYIHIPSYQVSYLVSW